MTWIIRCAGCGAETDHLRTPTTPEGWGLDEEIGRHVCPACNVRGAEEKLRARMRAMEAERDAMRHELAEMRAEFERERVRRGAAEGALYKVVRERSSDGK